LATNRIETFMTELSSVMRNWAEASTSRTNPALGAAPEFPRGCVTGRGLVWAFVAPPEMMGEGKN
jgi:hypothetical protein